MSSARFVTLNMLAFQKERDRPRDSAPEVPPFLQWQVGYVVYPKGSVAKFTIKSITNTRPGDPAPMSYHATVTLEHDREGDEPETRIIKGSTLQGGYYYHSGAAAPDHKDATKPLTVRVDAVREFYPRKCGTGTRLVMEGNTAYVVEEDYQTVRDLIECSQDLVIGFDELAIKARAQHDKLAMD